MADKPNFNKLSAALGGGNVDDIFFPKYKDTGRVKTSPLEALDAMVFAPTRSGIKDYLDNKDLSKAIDIAKNQFNKDPLNAPNYGDIAMELGANPITATAVETAGEILQPVGIPGSKTLSGVAGTIMKHKTPPVPNTAIREVADNYAKLKNLLLNRSDKPVELDTNLSKKLAKAYEEMKHNPDDPKVQEAYEALKKETRDQFRELQKAGLKVSRIEPGQENPYKNSQDLLKDLKENNHMWFYPTESGFGSSEKSLSKNPLLSDTDIEIGGKKLKDNDVFRIVHDYFGHGKEGYGFGPIGEEGAWRQHAQMYSPLAKKALTSETRGQNSFVNFGPNAEWNRANPGKTIYADQKVGILPDWALNESGKLTPEQASEQLKQLANSELVAKRLPSKILNESGSAKIVGTDPLESAIAKYKSGELKRPMSVSDEQWQKIQDYLKRTLP